LQVPSAGKEILSQKREKCGKRRVMLWCGRA
jgi:hypothetical protein